MKTPHLKLLRDFGLCVILTCMSLALCASQTSINEEWHFKRGEVAGEEKVSFDASDWEVVELPHTYNPTGTNEVYREQGEDLVYMGPAWYRKDLFVTQEQEGKRLFLKFEGAYLRSDVFVNGVNAGRHDGGFTAFCYEITDLVEYGSNNLIAVRVNNEFNDDITPLGGGYLKSGGITRLVWLLEKPEVCISPVYYASTGVYCRQIEVTNERVDLEIDTILNASNAGNGKYDLLCSILNAEGALVEQNRSSGKVKSGQQWKVTIPMQVNDPELWRGLDNPALYHVKVELIREGEVVDQVIERTGFRTVHVDVNEGFFLNGKSYPLYGCAQHQYYPGVGSAMREEHFDKDMELMRDLGMNAVRLSHYPHNQYRFDLCDENGITAFTELAMINTFNGRDGFTKNCKQQILEMVHQLYNHPSVAIWGLFNELHRDEFSGFNGLAFLADLNAEVKAIDPTRLTVGVSWKTGKRNDIADLSGWNRYQGWYWNAYEGGPDDFSWIDDIRSQHPYRRLGITEYGAGGAINHFDEHRGIAPFNRDQFHPQDFYNWSHELHWKEMQKRPWLWGSYIWTFSEFLVPNYDQGRSTFLHDKGMVSEDREQFKDAYFFYKANWNDEPMLHLNDKRFDVRLLDSAEITAYSNLGEVTLYVNGSRLGTIEDAEYGIYRWNAVPLKPGPNEIVVESGGKGMVYREQAVWHRVKDIHHDSVLSEIVPAGSEWSVLFSDEKVQLKKGGRIDIPGAGESPAFIVDKANWEQLDKDGESVKLPLDSGRNWFGVSAYLQKSFEVSSDGLSNPHLYLKQTARLSLENPGKVTVYVDGRSVLGIEEGCEGYRLIPISERLGSLEPGYHVISVVAEHPEKGGILDIGLVDKLK